VARGGGAEGGGRGWGGAGRKGGEGRRRWHGSGERERKGNELAGTESSRFREFAEGPARFGSTGNWRKEDPACGVEVGRGDLLEASFSASPNLYRIAPPARRICRRKRSWGVLTTIAPPPQSAAARGDCRISKA